MYSNDGIELSTENLKLKSMFAMKKNKIARTNDELGLYGNSDVTLDNMFKTWAGIDDNNLKVNTFSELKNDFDAFCNMFSVSSVTNEVASYTATIRYSNYNLKYFDLAKLDNFICDNEYIKTYNAVNKLFFKNDLLRDEMLYDNSNIKLKIDVKDFGAELNIFVEAVNDYSEKNEYTINMKRLKLNEQE